MMGGSRNSPLILWRGGFKCLTNFHSPLIIRGGAWQSTPLFFVSPPICVFGPPITPHHGGGQNFLPPPMICWGGDKKSWGGPKKYLSPPRFFVPPEIRLDFWIPPPQKKSPPEKIPRFFVPPPRFFCPPPSFLWGGIFFWGGNSTFPPQKKIDWGGL